jgi:hypothetical protein
MAKSQLLTVENSIYLGGVGFGKQWRREPETGDGVGGTRLFYAQRVGHLVHSANQLPGKTRRRKSKTAQPTLVRVQGRYLSKTHVADDATR